MKVFSILSLLLFTSCGLHIGIESTPTREPVETSVPESTNIINHPVGTCLILVESSGESWDKEGDFIIKIVQVGKKQYLATHVTETGEEYVNVGIEKWVLDDRKVVKCPKEVR